MDDSSCSRWFFVGYSIGVVVSLSKCKTVDSVIRFTGRLLKKWRPRPVVTPLSQAQLAPQIPYSGYAMGDMIDRYHSDFLRGVPAEVLVTRVY